MAARISKPERRMLLDDGAGGRDQHGLKDDGKCGEGATERCWDDERPGKRSLRAGSRSG